MGKEILLLLVMFWNVENFFDPFEGNSHGFADSLQLEEPYTPKGEKFWTWKKFTKKRDDIARTVALVKECHGLFPVIIGLCEIENSFVLNQLTQNTILSKLDYGVIHRESPDKRGIDVALLYRKELFKPFEVKYCPIKGEDVLQTREMVYVKGVFGQLDTLHCIVVHWPSKLGGERVSMPKRMAASNTLKFITDSILTTDNQANIIVMGDFNDGIRSEPLTNIGDLVNMSEQEFKGVKQREIRREPHRWFTYKYRESWERIDHFLISTNLWRSSGSVCSSVFGPNFLLEEDMVYFGYKIRRTLTGPRYNGGVSDHLPIILKVWGREY